MTKHNRERSSLINVMESDRVLDYDTIFLLKGLKREYPPSLMYQGLSTF